MRATRLVYVENDPALRGILSRALAADPGIDLLLSTGLPDEALGSDAAENADAALLDLALGTGASRTPQTWPVGPSTYDLGWPGGKG